MKLIDTHAHLDQILDIDRVLAGAYRQGVEGIVAMSIDNASCQKNLEIKKSWSSPHIFLAMGMHPSEICLEGLESCVQLIRSHSNELSAIGEIGLDFWYPWVRKNEEMKNAQRAVFRTLLELAKDLDLPAVIHARGTWQECFQAACEVGVKCAEFHWYSGPIDVLRGILDSGYYVSASPSLAYSPQSREAISFAPVDRIMIETDSPVFYRNRGAVDQEGADEGFQAEPKDVFKTLEAYCLLKNIKRDKAADIFNRNASDFFRLDAQLSRG